MANQRITFDEKIINEFRENDGRVAMFVGLPMMIWSLPPRATSRSSASLACEAMACHVHNVIGSILKMSGVSFE